MENKSELNIIFLYEPKSIEALVLFFNQHTNISPNNSLVIALDPILERLLVERNISFVSGREYRTPDPQPLISAEAFASEIFENKKWEFFSYRGVSLGRLFFFPLQMYLAPLLYFADIVSNAIRKHGSVKRLITFPPSVNAPSMGFFLENLRLQIFVDVVSAIGAQSAKEVLILDIVKNTLKVKNSSFILKRFLWNFCLTILNSFVSLLPAKKIRILVSDYWRNLAPYVKNIDSAEIFLLDRTEAFKAGIVNIVKFQMRFVHTKGFATKASEERKKTQFLFEEQWQSIKKENLPDFQFRGYSLLPIIITLLERVMEYASADMLMEIDSTYSALQRIKPSIVILRSTMSGQPHFVILAQVATALGIPSLEMQHGLEYYGPGSMDRRHSAKHMGAYGSFIQEEMKAAGDSINTHAIGSPRFDVYSSPKGKNYLPEGSDNKKLSVLCIVPTTMPGVGADSYDIAEYLEEMGNALRVVGDLDAVIKMRPGISMNEFYQPILEKAFQNVSYTIVQNEPLYELYPKADIVVSFYSTAALEALQCEKPLIYLGLSAVQKMMGEYHFAYYLQAGAMAMAKTGDELATVLTELSKNPESRRNMAQSAKVFLEENYSFDGKSSERAALLIEKLAKVS